MTVLKPKSRMISVRLSEEEYASLLRCCAENGARSVSDLTRDAVREMLHGMSGEPALASRLEDFQVQIGDLDRKMEELSERVSSAETGMAS